MDKQTRKSLKDIEADIMDRAGVDDLKELKEIQDKLNRLVKLSADEIQRIKTTASERSKKT